jgi:hypothetical protein
MHNNGVFTPPMLERMREGRVGVTGAFDLSSFMLL